MRRVIGSVSVAVWLGLFTVTASQLPPEIMVDRYLLQTEDLMAKKDYKAALELMDKIMALRKEHGLKLPDEFYYKYAQIEMSVGSIKTAMDSVSQYLTTAGRDGEFYREALKLMNQAEQILTLLDKYPGQIEQLMVERDYEAALELMDKIMALQKEHEFHLPEGFTSMHAQVARLTQTCEGQSKGAACWMELTNQKDCYVWNPNFHPDKGASWSSECSQGLAQGAGTLAWSWRTVPTLRNDSRAPSTVEPKCEGQSKGAACWMELANQKDCYVWNPNLQKDETVTWTAECKGGLAHAIGTITWVWDDGKKLKNKRAHMPAASATASGFGKKRMGP